jgi:hypothetical protein
VRTPLHESLGDGWGESRRPGRRGADGVDVVDDTDVGRWAPPTTSPEIVDGTTRQPAS